MPVYDKPMIYYPISTLMQAGISDILIITTPSDAPLFKTLLGDGTNCCISISSAKQEKPDVLAQAFLIVAEFMDKSSVCLILVDTIFYGNLIEETLINAFQQQAGASIFAYYVTYP